ncbi:MAG: isopentenyl-diphosphate Delta-isomerase [Flavobacteriaceae bacterium]|nr:isopentenyl-diphosphate Delta-isomerase [Flavobacteriaceae bacterium]
MEEEKVILVTPKDEPIGMMPKMEAHEKAVLHRAFSVFVINSKNELMLQQRAFEKYHSPGLWTNTCCSHQRSQEGNIEAGTRRLKEEMGFETDLEYLFNFIYKAPFDNGLTEHELDHVMLGRYENKPKINPNEVASWKWMHIDKIHVDLINNTENYTAWFAIIFERFYNHLKEQI